MANANNGNQFREDGVIILEQLRDGKMVKSIHPKIGGRLRLAHEQNQQISITTEIIKYDENVAVVKSVTATMKGSFPGIGMASMERDSSIAPAILELAETRAIARSLRFAGYGVDQNPKDTITPHCGKGIRSNRFQSFMGCDRMKELLCVGKYSEWDNFPPLKIPFQDLFRFWWNRCVQQEDVADEILEDIFTYFTALMQPPVKEQPEMDLTLDFDQLPLFVERTDRAA